MVYEMNAQITQEESTNSKPKLIKRKEMKHQLI